MGAQRGAQRIKLRLYVPPALAPSSLAPTLVCLFVCVRVATLSLTCLAKNRLFPTPSTAPPHANPSVLMGGVRGGSRSALLLARRGGAHLAHTTMSLDVHSPQLARQPLLRTRCATGWSAHCVSLSSNTHARVCVDVAPPLSLICSSRSSSVCVRAPLPQPHPPLPPPLSLLTTPACRRPFFPDCRFLKKEGAECNNKRRGSRRRQQQKAAATTRRVPHRLWS